MVPRSVAVTTRTSAARAWLRALAVALLTVLCVPKFANAAAFTSIAETNQLAPTLQSTRHTSPTRAQGAWLGTRPSTSLGEVDHPQRRRREDGRVGATLAPTTWLQSSEIF